MCVCFYEESRGNSGEEVETPESKSLESFIGLRVENGLEGVGSC